jgi:quinoprotein dehydrogenase-associated probable ABC transporter substrate-binding protein
MRRIDGLRRVAAAFALLIALVPAATRAGTLKICSDPNNLPYSNRAGQGFEDAVARLAARDLGDSLQYTYAIENARFLKRTLGAGKCDVLMGVPVGLEKLSTTRPYYTSSYVFVSRKSSRLRLASFADPRLRRLKIAVHLIGDDSTPPVLALAREGIVDNVQGFVIDSGFDQPNHAARPILAVETGRADVAAVWGPLAGYYAKRSTVPLALDRVRDGNRFAPLKFAFPIAIGVRKADEALRLRLDRFLATEQPAIKRILERYGVPVEDSERGSSDG